VSEPLIGGAKPSLFDEAKVPVFVGL